MFPGGLPFSLGIGAYIAYTVEDEGYVAFLPYGQTVVLPVLDGNISTLFTSVEIEEELSSRFVSSIMFETDTS